MTSQSADRTSSSKFFEVVAFVLPILVTGPSFMLISLLALELQQLLFMRDLTRILEIGISLV